MLKINVTASPKFGFFFKIYDNQGCRGYVDPHGYGYGVGMGMIFHPHRPMGILWGFLINLK